MRSVIGLSTRGPDEKGGKTVLKRALLLCLVTAAFAVWSGAAQATPAQTLTISVSRPPDVWSTTGAFSDSGSFAEDNVVFTKSFTYHTFRTFSSSAGTFTARADVRILPTGVPGVFAVDGRWVVIAGTGAYADLHGTGTISETFNAVPPPSVVGTWEGSVHFD